MIDIFIKECKNIISFFKKPDDSPSIQVPKSDRIKFFASILLMDLAMTSGIIFIIDFIIRLGFLDNMESHQMNKLLESSLPLAMLIFVVILTVVVTPFIEELIFRLFLRFRYNPVRIIILLLSPNQQEAKQASLRKVLNRNYGLFFYFSVVLFAGVHLFNFELDENILRWSLVLLMPQLILGFFAGYLRLKYGFVWGYYLHVLHNFVFIGSSLLIRSL